MSATVTIDYVSHTFRGHREPTLSSVDARIEAGERVALVGRSGCGKTTLLQMMAGLLLPSEGVVRINNRQVTRPNARWNLMFQKACLYPWLNVRENVRLGCLFAGRTEGMEDRVDRFLELVGLGDRRDAPVQSLSGGQQQRVALARSLSLEPELLLLDEPFSALDTFTRGALQDDVAQIAADQDLTMVLITHDIDEAVAMADRVFVMAQNPGRVLGEEPIPLAFPRNRHAPEFSRVRERLMHRFEAASGLQSGNEAAETPSADTQPPPIRRAV
ncbi:ABC transporter ATP-binding protein [Thiohalorhabdus sp. Cl-TMA]|uniref:ABC transporter ATP-binding protein n=1 Tax=Thiohalorhabdus methylotrophus TaxID=3242694 RepID=A0ABV4TWC2_9GAMM